MERRAGRGHHRSALTPQDRQGYFKMNREGRAIPFDKSFREIVIKGLNGWEEMRSFVGVRDYLGLAAALHKYNEEIKPTYRCVLVAYD